jgi:hypothetical protein
MRGLFIMFSSMSEVANIIDLATMALHKLQGL